MKLPQRRSVQAATPAFVGSGRFAEWRVHSVVGSDVGGWYYALNVLTSRGESSVNVKLSPKGKLVCLSCLRHDGSECEHARFVNLVIDAEGLPQEVVS